MLLDPLLTVSVNDCMALGNSNSELHSSLMKFTSTSMPSRETVPGSACHAKSRVHQQRKVAIHEEEPTENKQCSGNLCTTAFTTDLSLVVHCRIVDQ